MLRIYDNRERPTEIVNDDVEEGGECVVGEEDKEDGCIFQYGLDGAWEERKEEEKED